MPVSSRAVLPDRPPPLPPSSSALSFFALSFPLARGAFLWRHHDGAGVRNALSTRGERAVSMEGGNGGFRKCGTNALEGGSAALAALSAAASDGASNPPRRFRAPRNASCVGHSRTPDPPPTSSSFFRLVRLPGVPSASSPLLPPPVPSSPLSCVGPARAAPRPRALSLPLAPARSRSLPCLRTETPRRFPRHAPFSRRLQPEARRPHRRPRGERRRHGQEKDRQDQGQKGPQVCACRAGRWHRGEWVTVR